jgi:hypothetical protein
MRLTAAFKNKGGRVYFEPIIFNKQLEVSEHKVFNCPYFLKL